MATILFLLINLAQFNLRKCKLKVVERRNYIKNIMFSINLMGSYIILSYKDYFLY